MKPQLQWSTPDINAASNPGSVPVMGDDGSIGVMDDDHIAYINYDGTDEWYQELSNVGGNYSISGADDGFFPMPLGTF